MSWTIKDAISVTILFSQAVLQSLGSIEYSHLPLNLKMWGHHTDHREMNQQIYYLPAPFMGFGVVERHLDPLTPTINESGIRTVLIFYNTDEFEIKV